MFGPRGVGKSTLIQDQLKSSGVHTIDLLLDEVETRYKKNPDLLIADVKALKTKEWIIIDEVQKIPKLLDLVHKLIVEHKIKFALTGSSSRKLKRESANLLAGRAFIQNLFPLTFLELEEKFLLSEVLRWGSMPQLYSYDNDNDKKLYLNSYIRAYLKEEIILEQLVRNVEGFRDFLEIAAQMNGRIINLSKIGREASIDAKTVKEYFQILEDTLIGFWVSGYHKSVRKSQTFQSKFYLFDVGIQRAIEGSLDSPPVPGTSAYGQYFENYFFTEVFRFNEYSQKNYKIAHYNTTTGQEIDLILSKGRKTIAVEIKSRDSVDPTEVREFSRRANAIPGALKYWISLDKTSSEIDGVHCLYYQNFLKEIFEL